MTAIPEQRQRAIVVALWVVFLLLLVGSTALALAKSGAYWIFAGLFLLALLLYSGSAIQRLRR